MASSKTKIIFSSIIIVAIFFISGCGLKATNKQIYSMKLEVWGLFDDREAFAEIIENYRKLNPNVADINYKKLTPDTYKKDLLEALASGQGPDIFLVRNNWFPSFADKVAPAPAEILPEQKFRSDFADVVANDFLNQGQAYAVPLSVNSLALFYNKDLFNAAGITAPPKTWEEFVEDTKRLTRIGAGGQILQYGAAMGTAYNINRSTDILGLLMLQGGTEMIDKDGRKANFDQSIKVGNDSIAPGENALNFYTQFAKNKAPFYTWNSSPLVHYSLDAFSEGTLAMMLNYSWNIRAVEDKAPKLNFAVAPAPQLPDRQPVNYANYWGYAVAKNKIAGAIGANPNQPQISNETRVAEAWRFLRYLTTKPDGDINIPFGRKIGDKGAIDPSFDPAANYLEKVKAPAARKDLIEKQKIDPKIGVFAEGNLIARSWLQADAETIEGIFMEMINSVNQGSATPTDAIRAAAARVTQLMQ